MTKRSRTKKALVFQAFVLKPVSQLRAGDPLWYGENKSDTIVQIYTIGCKKVFQTHRSGCYFAEELVVRK